MQFGTIVLVRRGGGGAPGTPGSTRKVLGKLIGARGYERYVRLLEDDPCDTVGWNKKGDIGHWSNSVIEKAPEK